MSALSPEFLAIATSVAGTIGGAIAGWIMAGRRADLELRNQGALAEANYLHASNLQELAQYIARKHRVVAELHIRLTDAKSKILGLGRNTLRPQLDRANAEDVEKYMERQEVLRGVRDEVMRLWATDKEAATAKLYDWLGVFEGEKAQRSLIRARNYVLDREPYLSEPTVKQVLRMLVLLEHLLWQTKPPFGLPFGVPQPPDPQEVMDLHENIKGRLRLEVRPTTSSEGVKPGGTLGGAVNLQ